LVNYRPEYSHQWNSKTYYTQLRLDPLGRESAEEMLSALLSIPLARSVTGEGKRGEEPRAGEGPDLAALKRLIIEKTEGNPFFMEETVQVLYDEGALVRDGSAVKLTKPLDRCAEDSADRAGDSGRAHRPLARRRQGAAADAGRDRA
jgi:predicted ATPase